MVRDETKTAEYAEHAAAVLTGAGFPKMPARVLMALSTSETGLTAADLASRLGASAAAISGAVRYLQTLAMVNRVSQPGSRRDLYVLPSNAWYTATMAETRVFDAFIALTDEALDSLGEPGSPARERAWEMAEFMRFFRRRLPQLLEEWVAGGAARGA